MKKKILLILICVCFIFVFVLIMSILIEWNNTQCFISKIEDNTAINEDDKNDILEIYEDNSISYSDKKEFAQIVEDYPEFFTEKSNFKIEEENFSNLKSDYEVIVEAIISYIETNQYTEPYCVKIYKEDNRVILRRTGPYENAVFELDESIYQSMQKIEESFYDMGYPFWTIRIEKNTICFDTQYGEYDIIYSIDGLSPEEKGMNVVGVDEYSSINITGNWYHRFLK